MSDGWKLVQRVGSRLHYANRVPGQHLILLSGVVNSVGYD
ncbi:hypothetical protein WUBG_13267 [Wuchereria bancrofti]|uniref:Uncharacterized protein n=1 Tax=Wuchereria bancrofti TaxID=6293 RepID=J9ANF2_WUCBA|nr:hypothetical protein WUBG_13267 [Wuchereria bancrofti]